METVNNPANEYHLYLPDTFDGRPVTVVISAADYKAIIARYGTLTLYTWTAYKRGRKSKLGKKDSK